MQNEYLLLAVYFALQKIRGFFFVAGCWTAYVLKKQTDIF